jgi:hypothetical protein
MQELELATTRAAKRFDQRHPVLSGLVSSLLFASVGLLSALFAAYLIRTEDSGVVVVAMIVGTAVGACGAVIWAYAFAHEFVVPVWLGRLLFILTLATLLGGLGAIAGNRLLQAMSVAMLASRLLPQSVLVLLLARADVRHPEKRADRVRNSTTMAAWPGRK